MALFKTTFYIVSTDTFVIVYVRVAALSHRLWLQMLTHVYTGLNFIRNHSVYVHV